MAKVPLFYSVNEGLKPAHLRVYHNDNTCPSGSGIPPNERRLGTGGYRLCEDCQRR
ncbi:MAG: hypothetical protein ABSE55_05745 [Terracidiphilus sp.]